MPAYCEHRDEQSGKCKLNSAEERATLSVDEKGICEVDDLEEYIGTSYIVRDRLCPRLCSTINLDPEGDD
jgi:hypothetical protein